MTLLKLRKTMTLLNVIELGEDVMIEDLDSIQRSGNVELNAATTKLPSFGTIVEVIFAEATMYTKKSVDTRLAFVEKLVGAKSLDAVIQVQSEYAKTSYADFVAQGTKMRELYSNLAKACFKPVDSAISKVQGFSE
jgi:hypothetical protein